MAHPAEPPAVAHPTAAAPAPRGRDARVRTGALLVIAAVAVTAALRATATVLVPLLTALFLIMLTRPLQCWVERRAPAWVAALVATLAVILGTAILFGGVVLSLGQLLERAPDVIEQLQSLVVHLRSWATVRGIPVPGNGAGADAVGPLAGRLLAAGGVTLERLGLIIAFYILGVLEVGAFRDRVRRRLAMPRGEMAVDITRDVARRVRRYLGAVTAGGVVAAVGTGLFAWGVGLDVPLLWGLSAFLLNYIPVIGPTVVVIPPTLYAMLQFESMQRVAIVFVGIGAIQFIVGNFVDPKLEGRALSLSPVAILVTVTFFGWLWGVLGALLAVPITVALLAVCERFDRARWIPALLMEAEPGE